MISVLFIGSLYWSQPPINRETGIQQCTSEDLKTKVMWSWVSNTGTSGLSESVKPTFLGSEVCNDLYYWATRSRKPCLSPFISTTWCFKQIFSCCQLYLYIFMLSTVFIYEQNINSKWFAIGVASGEVCGWLNKVEISGIKYTLLIAVVQSGRI